MTDTLETLDGVLVRAQVGRVCLDRVPLDGTVILSLEMPGVAVRLTRPQVSALINALVSALGSHELLPGLMLWQRHRTVNSRNCDHCPPRHSAVWIFHDGASPILYLCDQHARRYADTIGVQRPPRLPPEKG